MSQEDLDFMSRALELAEKGRGKVSPNPLVGALVVSKGEIVGQGSHLKAGNDHAEVIALREAGEKFRGGTLYVTLEPCCHQGKTPPCTDAIIRSGIVRVVVAAQDPNPLVCGGGMARLREAGIEVLDGVREEQARKQNEVFFKYIQTGLPFVTVKLAASMDGMVAAADGTSKWITGKEARTRVHLLRSWSDAVMVGIGTVLADDPLLTVRLAEGKDPLRVIIDPQLKTPLNANVVRKHTMICVLESTEPKKIRDFEESGVEIWTFPGTPEQIPLQAVLKKLGEHQVTSVLCEGGPSLATSLFRERLADKLVYMIAPMLLGRGKSAFDQIGVSTLGEAFRLREVTCEQIGGDFMFTGYPVQDSPPRSSSLTS